MRVDRDREREKERDSDQVRSEAGKRTDLWTVQQLLSTATETATGGCCSGS